MKYVPLADYDAKKKEFLNLRQRGMSVAEYEQQFLRLSLSMMEVLLKRKKTSAGNLKMV